MAADRLTSEFNGEWSESSKGSIEAQQYYPRSGLAYSYSNSLMYTMWVNNDGDPYEVTLYNYRNDDYFYVYVTPQGDPLKADAADAAYASPPGVHSSENARPVRFTIPSGIHRIDIVKNDIGGVENYFELKGDIISPNIEGAGAGSILC